MRKRTLLYHPQNIAGNETCLFPKTTKKFFGICKGGRKYLATYEFRKHVRVRNVLSSYSFSVIEVNISTKTYFNIQ